MSWRTINLVGPPHTCPLPNSSRYNMWPGTVIQCTTCGQCWKLNKKLFRSRYWYAIDPPPGAFRVDEDGRLLHERIPELEEDIPELEDEPIPDDPEDPMNSWSQA